MKKRLKLEIILLILLIGISSYFLINKIFADKFVCDGKKVKVIESSPLFSVLNLEKEQEIKIFSKKAIEIINENNVNNLNFKHNFFYIKDSNVYYKYRAWDPWILSNVSINGFAVLQEGDTPIIKDNNSVFKVEKQSLCDGPCWMDPPFNYVAIKYNGPIEQFVNKCK